MTAEKNIAEERRTKREVYSSGFTLIELMVVLVVIAILGGITLSISKYITIRARQANQKIYIEKIKSALEDYRAAYGEYPVTPSTNLDGSGRPLNYADAVRHYPENVATYCAAITQGMYSVVNSGNSPYTNVCLATNTVEEQEGFKVDYCLTYPLMIRQREEGSRPFMVFKDETVRYLVYNPKQESGVDQYGREGDRGTIIKYFRTKLGDIVTKSSDYLRGNPINRPKAIDPVSRRQWKYISEDGVTYILTNHAGF